MQYSRNFGIVSEKKSPIDFRNNFAFSKYLLFLTYLFIIFNNLSIGFKLSLHGGK